MSVFHYPKVRHTRRLTPPAFKRYQSYKRYLQHEFERVCVYCRQPDTSSPSLNFQVDHYRPKSLPQFAELIRHWGNLYYCCAGCNSRKGDYWPADPKAGPMIPNPCDHEMARHLRLNASDCRIETHSRESGFTAELLSLNDDDMVAYRRVTLRLLSLLAASDPESRQRQGELKQRLGRGEIAQADFDLEVAHIDADLAANEQCRQVLSGTLPPRPLPRRA